MDESSVEDYGSNLESLFAKSDEGTVEIGSDVVARIAEIAVGELDGVAIEKASKLQAWIGGSKEKDSARGITVDKDSEDNSVSITVVVRMAYGQDMHDLAVRLRKHIKENVEKMTRVVVRRVDVRIVGIIVQDRDRRPQNDDEPMD